MHGPHDQLLDMCASINDKSCNYRPCKSFITQNHLLSYGKKHMENFKNSYHRENLGKTQGILSRLEYGHPGMASNPNDASSFVFLIKGSCDLKILLKGGEHQMSVGGILVG